MYDIVYTVVIITIALGVILWLTSCCIRRARLRVDMAELPARSLQDIIDNLKPDKYFDCTSLYVSPPGGSSSTESYRQSSVGYSEEKSLSFQCPDLSPIVDYGNWPQVKFFFEKVFCPSDKPVAVLLVGPPATGKTALAHLLCEALGDECLYVRCESSELTGAGLRELLLQRGDKIKLLVLDEFDKARPEVYELMLTVLDDFARGVQKVHASERKVLRTCFKVLALANSLAELRRRAGDKAGPLLSRFFPIIELKPPRDQEEAKRILVSYLVKQYGIDHRLAELVAEKCRLDWRCAKNAAELVKSLSLEDARRVLELIAS